MNSLWTSAIGWLLAVALALALAYATPGEPHERGGAAPADLPSGAAIA